MKKEADVDVAVDVMEAQALADLAEIPAAVFYG